MNLHTKIYLSIAAIVLLGATVGAREWIDQHDARLRAETTVQAQKDLQASYNSQFADLQKNMAERDAAYQQQIQGLTIRFQSATSPNQIAQLASQIIGLKQPISIVTPPATAQNPNPQPIAQVSTSDAPQVKAYVEACETCKLKLAKATADAADREAQAHLAQLQIDSLKKENTSLQTAVKGGTFFHRLGKATKYIIVGAAGGVVAICVTGHCK